MPSWGQRTGTLTGNAVSIGTSLAATTLVGSGAVQVGDLIFVVVGEQTTNTVTSVTDNLSNTYTALHAAVDSGTATARPFYSRVTNPGTISSVTATANGGTNNGVIAAAIFSGPFKASPLDKSPTATSDNASPFTAPTTTALAQIYELAVSWNASTGNATFSATSPNLKDVEIATASVMSVRIGSQTVAATTALTPEWTGTNPTDGMAGVATFMVPIDDPIPNEGRYTNTHGFQHVHFIPAPPEPIKVRLNRAAISYVAASVDQGTASHIPKVLELDDPMPTVRRNTVVQGAAIAADPVIYNRRFHTWNSDHDPIQVLRVTKEPFGAIEGSTPAVVNDPPFNSRRFGTWSKDVHDPIEVLRVAKEQFGAVAGAGDAVVNDPPFKGRKFATWLKDQFDATEAIRVDKERFGAIEGVTPAQVDDPPFHRLRFHTWTDTFEITEISSGGLITVDQPKPNRFEAWPFFVDSGTLPTLKKRNAALFATAVAQVDNPPFTERKPQIWFDATFWPDIKRQKQIVSVDNPIPRRARVQDHYSTDFWPQIKYAKAIQSVDNPPVRRTRAQDWYSTDFWPQVSQRHIPIDTVVVTADAPPVRQARAPYQWDLSDWSQPKRVYVPVDGTVVAAEQPLFARRLQPWTEEGFWPSQRRNVVTESVDNPPVRRARAPVWEEHDTSFRPQMPGRFFPIIPPRVDNPPIIGYKHPIWFEGPDNWPLQLNHMTSMQTDTWPSGDWVADEHTGKRAFRGKSRIGSIRNRRAGRNIF